MFNSTIFESVCTSLFLYSVLLFFTVSKLHTTNSAVQKSAVLLILLFTAPLCLLDLQRELFAITFWLIEALTVILLFLITYYGRTEKNRKLYITAWCSILFLALSAPEFTPANRVIINNNGHNRPFVWAAWAFAEYSEILVLILTPLLSITFMLLFYFNKSALRNSTKNLETTTRKTNTEKALAFIKRELKVITKAATKGVRVYKCLI